MSEAIQNQSAGVDLATRIYRDGRRRSAPPSCACGSTSQEHGFGGFWHPGIGQEGLQAGAVAALRRDDYLFYAHRGLGYALAKGMSLESLFGDLFGRVTGSDRRQGRRHGPLRRPRSSASSDRAERLARTSRSAQARRSRPSCSGADRVVGGLLRRRRRRARHLPRGRAPGLGLEAAGGLDLREQRLGALGAVRATRARPSDIADRAAGYGIPGVVVDGQDALAVYEAAPRLSRARAPARGRRWSRPRRCGSAATTRAIASPTATTSDADVREIHATRSTCSRALVPTGVADQIEADARAHEVEAALRGDAGRRPRRRATSSSKDRAGHDGGDARRRERSDRSATRGRSTHALAEEMRRDERVWMMGQDIGRMGGVFGVTRGLLDEFGADRVRDTTINETFIVGGAAGAAMTGHDPRRRAAVRRLPAHRRRRDLPQAGQVALHARRQARAAGRRPRCRPGVVGGAGAEHSQSLEALAMHVPGPEGRAARHARRRQGPAEDGDPRPATRCSSSSTRASTGSRARCPTPTTTSCPFGEAAVRRAGRDLTVVATGADGRPRARGRRAPRRARASRSR